MLIVVVNDLSSTIFLRQVLKVLTLLVDLLWDGVRLLRATLGSAQVFTHCENFGIWLQLDLLLFIVVVLPRLVLLEYLLVDLRNGHLVRLFQNRASALLT